jgi:hypothetical protein
LLEIIQKTELQHTKQALKENRAWSAYNLKVKKNRELLEINTSIVGMSHTNLSPVSERKIPQERMPTEPRTTKRNEVDPKSQFIT